MRAVRALAEQPTCASRGLGTVLPLSVLCLFGLVQTLATSCDATAPGNLCSAVMTVQSWLGDDDAYLGHG